MGTEERKNILLVEDSATIAMMEADKIKRFGYEVLTASSGEEAVEIAVNNKKVGLILMDIELGEGIDGSEAAKQILSVRHLPIVFHTAHTEKEYIDRLKTITRYGVVAKNSSDFVLESSIGMALELFEANRSLEYKMELLQKANDDLRKLSLAVEQSSSSIVITDLDANIEYVNKAFVMLTGYSFAEAVGQNPRILKSGKTPQETYDELWACLKRGEMWKGEFINRSKHGKEYIELAVISPVRQADGHITHYLAIKDDITERKKDEGIIKNLLAEKELILKEVHHRIKNNMNSIVSLLHFQAKDMKTPEAVSSLEDAQNRVHSMMVLYDKLYRSKSFMEISFKDYLAGLIEEITANLVNRERVKVETHIEDFIIDTKVLSALGIIINEIITNAMKYAFRGKEEGLVSVSAALKDKLVTLVIADNGIGIPESIDIESSPGFGLELVSMLTKQLKGNLKIERLSKDLPSGQYVDTAGGTRVIIELEI